MSFDNSMGNEGLSTDLCGALHGIVSTFEFTCAYLNL